MLFMYMKMGCFFLWKWVALFCISCWPHSFLRLSLSSGLFKMTLTYSIGLLLPCFSYYLKLGLMSLTWYELPVSDKNLSSKYLSACSKRFHSACLKYTTCNTPLLSSENFSAQFLLTSCSLLPWGSWHILPQYWCHIWAGSAARE